jgi:mannose-1-phosphate guanylyltransferase
MTLGIQPTFPNTGFGYIEYDKADTNAIKKLINLEKNPIMKRQNRF